MSLTKNKSIRCDWCGRLTRNRNGEYTKADGISAGYILQPCWERFPGGDYTIENISSSNDICEECAAKRCDYCGKEITGESPCEACKPNICQQCWQPKRICGCNAP